MSEKTIGRQRLDKCDTVSGPCSCGAWHNKVSLDRLSALERVAEAAKETEMMRAQYEHIRHQKPLDTNKELRAWLELMKALLNQKDALSALQPDSAQSGERKGE